MPRVHSEAMADLVPFQQPPSGINKVFSCLEWKEKYLRLEKKKLEENTSSIVKRKREGTEIYYRNSLDQNLC